MSQIIIFYNSEPKLLMFCAGDLVCELCRQFYVDGWVTGTGGSICIRFGNRIFMTPSGVQKERIQPEDLFVIDVKGNMLAVPSRSPGSVRPAKLSGIIVDDYPNVYFLIEFFILPYAECSPLFLVCFNRRKAGNTI